jgi:predicted HicB family RNase H-like nuclease
VPLRIVAQIEVRRMRQKQLVLQVPPELKAEAEKLAAAERRSLSNWLRTVLEDRVRGRSTTDSSAAAA